MAKKIKKLFISNHPSDVDLATSIEENLNEVKHNYNLIVYSAESLEITGDEINFQKQHIKDSDVIITVISANYLAWDFLHEKQQISIFKKKIIIPVYSRASMYEEVEWIKFAKKSFPENGIPFNKLSSKEQNKTLIGIASYINSSLGVRLLPNKLEVFSNYDVFISHDHDDGDFAELLQLKMNLTGINAWLDIKRIEIGDYWMKEIDSSISKAKVVIVVMSPEAKESEYVTYEWAYAIGAKKLVLPIILKMTDMHPRLKAIQYYDFTNRTVRPWEKLFKIIKDKIDKENKASQKGTRRKK